MSINFSPSFHYINLISQNSNRAPEAFSLHENNGMTFIKINHFIIELFLRIKHFICKNGDEHRKLLTQVIQANLSTLNQAENKEFVSEEAKTYQELFIASQRYNHSVYMAQDLALKKFVPLFQDLTLNTLINFPEAAPIKIMAENISQQKMANIPPEQEPYTIQNHNHHKIYYYSEADTHLSHKTEALRIFFHTQSERFLSLIGRIVESVAKLFGKEITYFNSYHYFRNGEDKTDEIYANDLPLDSTPHASSYWVGHATCLIKVPLKSSENDLIHVNLITDPIEGDIHALLYPRMTQAARTMDTCPIPHVFLLSHNHLDHYNKDTLEKLIKYQPTILVPEGDADKLIKLGFKNVYENNWWQTTTIPLQQDHKKGELKITAVPANHWSGQGPCDGHHAAFVGYVIHQDQEDIYFAGDTAVLSEEHVGTLKDRFNIRSMFQPGGPDEMREDMKSTHQASIDGLWMHFNLLLENLYQKNLFATKDEFMAEAKKLRTVFMHTKTYKLGNLHFDDTDASLARVRQVFLSKETDLDWDKCRTQYSLKEYEYNILIKIYEWASSHKFPDNRYLNDVDIVEIMDTVIVPKIGSKTTLAT